MSALVDSISGALAKSIGEAAAAKGNPLTYFEHKAAHFGVGALAGAILDKDHPLSDAIKGGIRAMMAEVVAESLVDRPQIQNEVAQELGFEEGRPLSPEDKTLFEATYREKLRPAMNTAKLVVAGVMASLGHDPSIAIVTASNALENNFIPSMTKSLMLAQTQETSHGGPSEFWQDEFDDPRDVYIEILREEERVRTTRALIDPETYNPIQAAHESNIDEFVEDRLAYDELKMGKNLTQKTRERLTQQYSKAYYALRQMEAHKEFVSPGYHRLAQLASLSFEELKAMRIKEMDPKGSFSATQRSNAEKIISNEYEFIKGKSLDLAIGAAFTVTGGKMVYPAFNRTKMTGTNRNNPKKPTALRNVEALDLAKTENSLVHWLDEKSAMNPLARAYNDSVTGARSNVNTKVSQAPSLYYHNSNGKLSAVRFDGVEGNVLIDRKMAIVTTEKAKNQALRQSEALKQNSLLGRWEVPDLSQQIRAEKMLKNLNVTNIEVEVANVTKPK